MSKMFWFYLLLAVLAAAFSVSITEGQDIDVTIRIEKNTPSVAHIDLGYPARSRFGDVTSLSFVRSFAGDSHFDKRISDVRVRDRGGNPVSIRQTVEGTYLSDRPIATASYQVDLSPRDTNALAHISWTDYSGGVLVPYDLLPRGDYSEVDGVIILDTPPGLKVATIEHGPKMYSVGRLDRTVFWLSSRITQTEAALPSATHQQVFLGLNIAGDWKFSDVEAKETASEVFRAHSEIFERRTPGGGVQIFLGKFPMHTEPGQWQAGTRGQSITILSSDMVFKSQSLQRLHEQLRHEIFHLWIPEGVNLTGNYDWFYEGFALYQSLKIAVGGNRIRFDDYLDTLSRAHRIDRDKTAQRTLIELSKARWEGNSESHLYARGMLVAFLCDLAMLDASKGKRSTDDLVREIYRKHSGKAEPQDGNYAVLKVIGNYPELAPIVGRYVTGNQPLDTGTGLAAAGLEIGKGNLPSIKVVEKPSARQKVILDKLGYNNWRKAPRVKQ